MMMLGGINGGFVLLEPSRAPYRKMVDSLPTWWTETNMAEQEFLSSFFAGKKTLPPRPGGPAGFASRLCR